MRCSSEIQSPSYFFKHFDHFISIRVYEQWFFKLLASNHFHFVCLLVKWLLNLLMHCSSEIESPRYFALISNNLITLFPFSKLVGSNHYDWVCLLVEWLLNLWMRCSSEIQSPSYFIKQFDHFVSIWVYERWFSKLLASNHFDLVCTFVKWLLNH